MRYALKVYYDGKGFSGSQIQPGRRTVEGELLGALKKLDPGAKNFKSAGRTDRGVSALGNVFAITTKAELRARAVNSFLPGDIRVLAIREVGKDFHPRYEAIERVYKYFLFDEGYDRERLEEAAGIFKGEHSFHNFCILEKRNPVRRIKDIGVEKVGGFFILSFYGESFLWQQVRRLVTAFKMIGKGDLTIEEAERYLDPEVKEKMPPAGAEGLVLWDVRYPFDFEYEDYTLRRFQKEIFRRWREQERRALIMKEMLKAGK